MISFDNVSLSATAGIVLKNISMYIEPEECVAIVGSSGSGKSLLLSILRGEAKPNAGMVLVDGLPLSKLSPKLLQLYRQSLGVVLQENQLLPDRSIAANVALPLEVRKTEAHQVAEQVMEILQKIGLEEKAAMLPEVLNHNEQRLVALAQAVIAQPQILVLDEPFDGLEDVYVNMMIHMLQTEKERGATIVLATHHPKSIQELEPRIVRLEKGELIRTKQERPVESSRISITPKAL